jgi:hypothetical protein
VNYDKEQSEAIATALWLHELVKNLANINTSNNDLSFTGAIHPRKHQMDIHYEARLDECHRSINIDIDGDKYRMWFECKGWVHMSKNGKDVYTQRLREDIKDKFEGDIGEFITVTKRIKEIFG